MATFGRSSMSVEKAKKLIHLARDKQDLGVHEQAAILFEQAITALARQNPTPHKYLAIALNDLGLLQNSLGSYTEALTTFSSALQHQELIFAQNHPEIAATQNNLGLAYKRLKNFAKAEEHYKIAADIYQASGNNTAEAAFNLGNLGLVYEALGQNPKAYIYLTNSLRLGRQILGDVHPQLAVTLYNLAALCTAKWHDSDCSPLDLMKEANAVDDLVIDQVFSRSSETERLRFLGTRFPHYHIFLSFTLHQMHNGNSAPIQEAYELVFRRKGLATEISTTKQTAVWRNQHPEAAELLNQLSLLRQDIAQKAINPLVPLATLNPLLQLKESLEAKLASVVPTITISQDLHQVNQTHIANNLPENSALVEFVRFEPYNFTAVLNNGDPRQHPPRYLAFVILAAQPNKIQLFDLGPAALIEKQVNDICYRMEQAGRESHEIVPDWLRLSQFDSIWTALGKCANVFIAPDGDLALLSFAILKQENGRHLLDDYTISYVMTGRDFLFPSPKTPNNPDVLLVTNPDFDLGLPGTSAAPAPFKPLNTAPKVWRKIEDLLGTTSITGQAATAQLIKGHQSPRIIHLNTHGFFFPYQNPNEGPSDDSEKAVPIGLQRLRQNRNALLRGGLVFAGANRWARGLPTTDPPGSGILTAEEIRNINLNNTELVVLSACDTGVGDALAGETVFGFRRAFTIAGAKTLVMSLWKIPEKYTPMLMYYFYDYLHVGLPPAEALRKAQLDLKKEGVSVFGWGAFICQGNNK